MKDSPPARLWFGRTTHTRLTPFRRSFTYRIAMLEIDIDRMEEAGRLAGLFSVGRGNLVSFRSTDHGARDAAVPLRGWAEACYSEAGVSLDGGAITLVTFPRVLGYGFAPISLWLGYGPEGDCRGVIYEVHNTFGETHAYVSALSPVGRRAVGKKDFHVSPFWSVEGQYRFTLRHPGDHLALTVENLSADDQLHVASMNLRPEPLTSAAIMRWLLTMPLSGLGVTVTIYWQALRLWLKGVRYYAKGAKRARGITLARPETPSSREEAPAGAQDLRKRA